MATTKPLHRARLIEELDKIPAEFLPSLLKLLEAFREGVTLPSAEESVRQGWKEAVSNQTLPVSGLWDDLDEA